LVRVNNNRKRTWQSKADDINEALYNITREILRRKAERFACHPGIDKMKALICPFS